MRRGKVRKKRKGNERERVKVRKKRKGRE